MDINRDIQTVEVQSNSSDSNSDTKSEADEELQSSPLAKKKKKVMFTDKEKPSEKIIPVSPPTPQEECIEQLSKQLEELVLSFAESRCASGLPSQNNFPNIVVNLQHCGMCGHIVAHQIGYRYCPKTGWLIDDNLIKYDKGGRLVLMDGNNLPRLLNKSSVAQAICDKTAASSGALKGKGCADFHNQLPHMASASFAGLQFNGEDVLNEEVLGVATVVAVPTWHAFAKPVTCLGKETH
ncbi:hypothetical protein H0H87_006531 [Tephrocybe sp. NHM501043]|nr:hypothetical protein H0H87_006531 [Tephrocybe sp. NHM501043]